MTFQSSVWTAIGTIILILWLFSQFAPVYFTIDGVTHSFKMGKK